jgi:hypothetical protein
MSFVMCLVYRPWSQGIGTDEVVFWPTIAAVEQVDQLAELVSH